MKKALVTLTFLLLLVLGSGCAELDTYMRNRGNDLADCFTARVGTGYGLGVRAQLTNYCGISAGASVNERKWGYFGREPVEAEGSWTGLGVNQLLWVGTLFPNTTSLLWGFLPAADVRAYDKSLPGGYTTVFGFPAVETAALRMEPPTPFLREKFFVEVGATLGAVSFDLGFNPVEFVDFLLGWTTLDITGDDTKAAPAGEQLAP